MPTALIPEPSNQGFPETMKRNWQGECAAVEREETVRAGFQG